MLYNLTHKQDERILNKGSVVHPLNRYNIAFRGGIRL